MPSRPGLGPASPAPGCGRASVAVLATALSAALAGCGDAVGSARERIRPAPGYDEAVAALAAFIEHEIEDKRLGSLSVALVDDGATVWAAGFGVADSANGIPATAATIYRVGSVSKLFTDIAIMQRVERHGLDLDAPITEALPELAFGPPLDGTAPARPPTIRELMSHRGGIVREPPVGHYFDAGSPSLATTIASLAGTPVIYEPGTRVKYSNAGIAAVGYALERLSGRPFAAYARDSVLLPLSMGRSAFEPLPRLVADLAVARMWSYDGREFRAPTFELGMSPAGSMYAPVTDLARFMSAVFAGRLGPDGSVLADTTLAEMLRPQFGSESGFGIGFGLGTLDGHRYAGHGGAIYGFATQLAMLPDERLGAVAVTTTDVANTVTDRVTDFALRLMLAVREDAPLPIVRTTERVPPGLAERLAGVWSTAEDELRIEIRARGAAFSPEEPTLTLRGARYRLRARADTLIVDDRHGFGGFFRIVDGALVARDGTRLERRHSPPGPPPAPAPERWLDLMGEYGWEHNVLFVYEAGGRLHALIEWIEMDALEELGPDVFAFPRTGGLYHGERLWFERDTAGSVRAAVAAGIRFPRRAVGTEGGATFTIEPVRPVAELREAALAASPSAETGAFREPDLVELTALDPSIRYDIRYAGTNNFMRTRLYEEPHAFLQRPAAEALLRAHRALARHGFGLLIHDAYRPWHVTKMFWDATPEEQKRFVADPAGGSRHNRGAAVDLTLYDLTTGGPVEMVGGYDEFSARSYPEYVGGTALQRWHRDLLRRVMEAEGFRVYPYEWWHFDHEDWSRYPILDLTFEELADRTRGGP